MLLLSRQVQESCLPIFRSVLQVCCFFCAAILTSNIICPAFISTTSIPLVLREISSIALYGNGHKVMGRSKPSFIPSARAMSTAFLEIRAAEPNATIT